MSTTMISRPDLGAHLTFEAARDRIDHHRQVAADQRLARLARLDDRHPPRDLRRVVGEWLIALGRAISPPIRSSDARRR